MRCTGSLGRSIKTGLVKAVAVAAVMVGVVEVVVFRVEVVKLAFIVIVAATGQFALTNDAMTTVFVVALLIPSEVGMESKP